MNLKELVPPLERCKLIPAGEFEDSCFTRPDIPGEPVYTRGSKAYEHLLRCGITFYPAPTLDEILDELHKCQEDVFLKWSERAYHEWLVNAYTPSRNEDYQAHDESKVIAALKVWLKMKGIEV